MIKFTYRAVPKKAQADFKKFKKLAEKGGISANRALEIIISEYVNKVKK